MRPRLAHAWVLAAHLICVGCCARIEPAMDSASMVPSDRFPELDAVTALFQDPSEEVRCQAVETAGKAGGPQIERDLLQVRESDPSPIVREIAAQSLIRLGLGNEPWEE